MTQITTTYTPEDMAEFARQARVRILEAVKHAGGGHVGGPYSAADMLAALYFGVLNIRPDEPDWPDRDRFVLSKGHSSIALYTMLALRGYFPVEELLTFDAINSRLQGHPDMTVTPALTCRPDHSVSVSLEPWGLRSALEPRDVTSPRS